MSDVVERAEAALAFYESSRGDDFRYKSALIRDLLAELKAARAENDRLRNELNQKLIEANLSGFTEGQRRIS